MLMVLPSLLLAIGIIGYPILDLAWTSMQEVSRFGKLQGFVGWENFGEVFGDPLFLRQQRGMLPTARAEALAGPLRKLLSEAGALLTPLAFDPATAQGTLRIAATDYAQAAVVLPLLAILRDQAPGLRIAVQPVAHVAAFSIGVARLRTAVCREVEVDQQQYRPLQYPLISSL